MKAEEFLALAAEHLPRLKAKYCLGEWWIYVELVEPDDLGGEAIAAQVNLYEEYRYAVIQVSQSAVRAHTAEYLLEVLEHEVQHVALWPLEAFVELVLSAVEEDGEAAAMLRQEGTRCNERLRSLLGRVTGRGNNWEIDYRPEAAGGGGGGGDGGDGAPRPKGRGRARGRGEAESDKAKTKAKAKPKPKTKAKLSRRSLRASPRRTWRKSARC